MQRRELERRILDWIHQGVSAPHDDARFETFALELFSYQYEHNEPYRRLCHALDMTPERVSRWQQIPAVPAAAFKQARLACFPAGNEVRVFRTSGSTTERRGELQLDTLELYDASLLETFGSYICPEGKRIPLLVLAPSSAEVPDSSLSYMFDRAVRAFGTGQSGFYVNAQGWDPAALIRDLAALEEPAAVVGTEFAFVHLTDELARRQTVLRLPTGTRIMGTGGFKGRSRELSRAELHAAIEGALGVPSSRIVNQYGMCELASQFYEATLRLGTPTCVKSVPPWVRTRVVDPATLEDVALGEVGVLVHYDLANTGSVLAVQTSDAGRLRVDGFELLGRLPGAELRGCSIAADTLLGKR